MTLQYSFSLTTFSPSGKLVQIEYALNAVAAGTTSLGIKVGIHASHHHAHLLFSCSISNTACTSARQLNACCRPYFIYICCTQMQGDQHIFVCILHHCVQATNGVVLATEKKLRSTLIDESTVKKISVVSPNIGLAYSGMGPDSRLLVRRARKQAQVQPHHGPRILNKLAMHFGHAAAIYLPVKEQCHNCRSEFSMQTSSDIMTIAIPMWRALFAGLL